MIFEVPDEDKITIYSKSGCTNCRIVKDLIKKANLDYEIIDCDDYLLENKEEFLEFIKSYSNKECKSFPIVFYNRTFVGGLIETKMLVEKINTINKNNLDFSDENF